MSNCKEQQVFMPTNNLCVIFLIIIFSNFDTVVHCQIYQATITMSLLGFEFHPFDPVLDQLNVFNANNLLHCYFQCDLQPLCCSLDFDFLTKRCRLFVFGTIIPSSSSSSQVGTVQYSPDLYIKYNQACTSDNNDISRYLICGNNNKYQCLTGFWWNGIMCTPMYWTSGTQMNLNSSVLRGWSLCYNDTYNIQLNGLPLNNILNTCNRSRLLMACGSIYTPNIYSVAAMGLRQDVLYDCANTVNCGHVANGVKWYFSGNYSWGFADQLDTVTRGWCDSEPTNPSHRLCWHTVPGYDGYRCGSTVFNLSVNPLLWQRVMWHAD